jgi:hypothetical protein
MAYYATQYNKPIPRQFNGLGWISQHETSRDQLLHGLGQGCPPCHILVGSQCVACPEESDLAECENCVEGQLLTGATPWYERPLAGPVLTALAIALATGIAVPILRRQLGKRGVKVE